MDADEVKRLLNEALRETMERDRHLLENDLSERCIAARLAIYMQPHFAHYAVDVEYNRAGNIPKMLGLPEECANYRDEDGRAFVVPDVIVHRRGPDGPNLLVLELKKTTNRKGSACDGRRVRAFRAELRYHYGALIVCETRQGRAPGIAITEWLDAITS